MSDRRKTGEGGIKGWATRRQNGTESPKKLRAEIERLRAHLSALWIAFQDDDAFRRVWKDLEVDLEARRALEGK